MVLFTFPPSEGTCEHHGEILKNQIEMRESQIKVESHLESMTDIAKIIKRTLIGCLGTLVVIALGVFKYGWELSLESKHHRYEIVRLDKQVGKLEESDKCLNTKVEQLDKEHLRLQLRKPEK